MGCEDCQASGSSIDQFPGVARLVRRIGSRIWRRGVRLRDRGNNGGLPDPNRFSRANPQDVEFICHLEGGYDKYSVRGLVKGGHCP